MEQRNAIVPLKALITTVTKYKIRIPFFKIIHLYKSRVIEMEYTTFLGLSEDAL